MLDPELQTGKKTKSAIIRRSSSAMFLSKAPFHIHKPLLVKFMVLSQILVHSSPTLPHVLIPAFCFFFSKLGRLADSSRENVLVRRRQVCHKHCLPSSAAPSIGPSPGTGWAAAVTASVLANFFGIRHWRPADKEDDKCSHFLGFRFVICSIGLENIYYPDLPIAINHIAIKQLVVPSINYNHHSLTSMVALTLFCPIKFPICLSAVL